MTVFLMICKRPECRAEYEADPDDIARGFQWWALCPACRDNPKEAETTPWKPAAKQTIMSEQRPHEREQEGDSVA